MSVIVACVITSVVISLYQSVGILLTIVETPHNEDASISLKTVENTSISELQLLLIHLNLLQLLLSPPSQLQPLKIQPH